MGKCGVPAETDLSLIEINNREDNENDFFLFPPIKENSSSDLRTFFSVSPIQNPNYSQNFSTFIDEHRHLEQQYPQVSQREHFKDKRVQKPDDSSSEDAENQENVHPVSESNLGMQTVREEPLQSRKRKKAGGCNLRKSLAWNSAFFTEEGVLDPVELSMLSGSFSDSSKNILHRGNKGGAISPIEDSSLSSNISDLQSNEEQFFKELPERSQNECQMLFGSYSALNSSTVDNSSVTGASEKVPVAKDIDRIAPQSGSCQQPLASQSQRRLITPKTKLLKTAVTRPDLFLPLGCKNAIQATKCSKCSGSALPVNVEKNSGHRGASGNTKNGLINTLSFVESSAHHSGKNMVHQPSESQLSNDTPLVGKGTIHSKVIQEPAFGVSKKAAVLLPPYHLKPSGLRTPSPSLGFFSQAKVTAQSVQAHDNAKPCNPSRSKCNISVEPSPGNQTHKILLKPSFRPVEKLPKMGIRATVAETTEAAKPGTHIDSAFGNLDTSTVISVDPAPESKLKVETSAKKEVSKASEHGSFYNQRNIQEHLHSICSIDGDGVDEQTNTPAPTILNPDEGKQISCHNNQNLQIKLPIQCECSGERKNDDDYESDGNVCPETSDPCGSEFACPHVFSDSIQLEGTTEPHNPSKTRIPTLTRPDNWNDFSNLIPLGAPVGKLSKVGSIATITRSTGDVESSTQAVSAAICSVPSLVTSSLPTLYSNSKLKTVMKAEVKGKFDSAISCSQNNQEHLQSDCLKTCENAVKQTRKQALGMPCSGDTEKILRQEYQNLWLTFPLESGTSKQFKKDNSLDNINNVSVTRRDSSGTELANPSAPCQLGCVNDLKQGTPGVNNPIEQPLAEDAGVNACNVISRCIKFSNGKQSVENSDFISYLQLRGMNNNINQVTSEEAESPLQVSKEHMSGTGNTGCSQMVCSSENMVSSVHTVPLSCPSVSRSGVNESVSKIKPEEGLAMSKMLPDDRIPSELKNDMYPSKDRDTAIPLIKSLMDDSKLDTLCKKYELNAAPFSDEWLAALQVAGEDILAMKTGAVQNSPPEKSLPEPGPWSPVKRTNKEIGPFDCTKYTNFPPPNAH